jgi:hypothetical protein
MVILERPASSRLYKMALCVGALSLLSIGVIWMWGCGAISSPSLSKEIDPAPRRTPIAQNLSPISSPTTAKVFSLQDSYLGEKERGVSYFSETSRSVYEVMIKDGKLCSAQGDRLDPQLSLPEHSDRTGTAIYVLDTWGTLYVTFDHRFGEVHHSSLVAGAPVLAAGEMVVIDGLLLSISNSSGHYKPPPHAIDVVLERLERLGADLSQVERFEIYPDGRRTHRMHNTLMTHSR